MIPYARQDISQADVDAVIEVLRSDFLTQGPKVPAFEQAVGDYCGASYAVAVNSGTSALHIACLALGLGVGDILWTSPITFVASANCALYCGADVDFVDIDQHTYNICPLALEQKLHAAKQSGRLPKIVVPVHFAGQPCDMEAIYRLSKQFGFKILEDASHALGARYKNEPLGNCRYSDITVFSFHPVKIITTGEGGMALTNDHTLANKMALLRSHGITRDPSQMIQESEGPWYYEQNDLGFNYRMTDIQATLGFSQIQRLDTFVSRRQELARRYGELLADFPVKCPWQHPDGFSSWHIYVIRLDLNKIRISHKDVFIEMHKKNIGINLHYIPIYNHFYYKKKGFDKKSFPASEQYYMEALTLPLYPGMSYEQQDTVVHALKKTIRV